MQVGECPYTVEFPGPVQSTTEVPKGAGADRAVILANLEGNTFLAAGCLCSNTLNWGDVPESAAAQVGEWVANSSGVRISDVHVTDLGSEGKSISATWEASSIESGPLQGLSPIHVEARNIYFGKCKFEVAAGGRTGAYDHARVALFRESARRVRAQPVTSVSPPPTDTRRRLEQLKDLYDRNLITPQEYDTRRKAILDAL
jgi:hypothetical protein